MIMVYGTKLHTALTDKETPVWNTWISGIKKKKEYTTVNCVEISQTVLFFFLSFFFFFLGGDVLGENTVKFKRKYEIKYSFGEEENENNTFFKNNG